MKVKAKPQTQDGESESASAVVPTGVLKRLRTTDIKPSTTNPRRLFDTIPLDDLRANIREHGVLVPITVYEIKGQKKYAILDGERRYKCCIQLEEQGIEITIPANVVEPPDKIAGLLYMFSIHNFRESWELMPTALSLKTIMAELGEEDNVKLSRLTGLSEPQIERCKTLLSFPESYQNLSLDPNPSKRIPANFWIEASPVLQICEDKLRDLYRRLGKYGILDKLVEKYQAKKIRSVIHFRRIVEAFETNEEDKATIRRIDNRLVEYVENVDLETRKAFDEFIVDTRRLQGAIEASDDFVRILQRSKLEHVIDRKEELRDALVRVRDYIQRLLQKLEGSDDPASQEQHEEDLG